MTIKIAFQGLRLVIVVYARKGRYILCLLLTLLPVLSMHYLTIFQVCILSILLAISKYIIIPVTSIIVVIRGADTIAGSSFK